MQVPTATMGIRAVVAGAGNVFLGDDGFGVEVVRRLARARLPSGVELVDVGFRGLWLAYDILNPPELLVVVDAVCRRGAPGTLHVVEPYGDGHETLLDAHGMDHRAIFAALAQLGGMPRRTVLVGCEPASLVQRAELSPKVQSAVEPAVRLVQDLVLRELGENRKAS